MDDTTKAKFCERLTALCRELGLALDADRMRLVSDDGRFYLANREDHVFIAHPLRAEELPG